MKRKILFFLTLLLVLALCFTACDTGNSGSNGNSGAGNNDHVGNTDQGIEITYYLTPGGEECRATVKDNKVSFAKTPERLGYQFLGLYNAPEGGSRIVSPTGDCGDIEINSSMKLYAHWRIRSYTVGFDPNGGELADAERAMSVLYGETLGNFPKPVREGYAFVGWFSDPGESGTQYSVAEKVNADKKTFDESAYPVNGDQVMLYAKWIDAKPVIIFDYNDGTYQNISKEFAYGATLSPSDFPEASDDELRCYEFVGWSLYRDRFVEFKGNVASDMTLYAFWREYKNVVFHYGGGWEETVRIYKDKGVTPCPAPEEKHYYTFEGWFDSPLFSGSPVTNFSFAGGTKDFYAKWIAKEYKINFVTDTLDPGSAFTPAEQNPLTLAYGSSLKNLPVPKCEGYDFIGWFDANGVQYSVGGATVEEKQTFRDEAYAIGEGGVTLYAKWQMKKFSVVFDYNDGTEKKDRLTINYGSTLDLVTLPEKDDGGKIIGGWSTDPNMMIAYQGGVTGDVTLYAIWIHYKTVTVYKENGEAPGLIRVYQNKPTDCPIPERAHYVFAGWYASKESEDPVTAPLTYDDGVTEIYAKWTPVEYKIHFVTGEGDPIDDAVYTAEAAYTLPIPKRNHYEFLGWHKNEDLSDESLLKLETGHVGDVTLYAEFGEIPHSYEPEITEPTCSEQGYTTYRCIYCDDSYTENYVEKLPHTPGDEATCTAPQICTVCNAELSPAQGHGYDAKVTEPTCTEKGYTTYTCTRCEDSYVADPVDTVAHTPGKDATCTTPQVCTVCNAELSPAQGHVYDAKVTPPTCAQKGYTTYTCNHCGDSYKADYTALTEHKPGKEATCTTAQTCLECKAVLISAYGHVGGDKATCTTAQFCTVCEKEIVPALGHAYKDTVTLPTCTAEGYTTHACDRCGKTYTDNITDVVDHTPGAAATCTTPQSCEVCQKVLVSAKGHDYKSAVTPSTCMEKGYTTHTCKRCDHSYVDSPMDALGHLAKSEATCTEAQSCARCDITLAPALGHDYASAVIHPTCSEKGYTEHICNRCSDTYRDDYIDSLPHTPGEQASCTTEQICTVCHTVLVPITHQLGSWRVLEWVTLTSDGIKESDCAVCHAKVTETVPRIEADLTFTSIGSIPERIEGRSNVLIDLLHATDVDSAAFKKVVIGVGVSTVHFRGKPGVTCNMNIVIDDAVDTVNIIFEDFDIAGNSAEGVIYSSTNGRINIYTCGLGNSVTNMEEAPAMKLNHASVSLIGDAKIDFAVKGVAAQGYNPPKAENGHRGEDGGNGIKGGAAVIVDSLLINSSRISFTGGKGGQGGKGGSGNTSNVFKPKNGGTGGNGGMGGEGLLVNNLAVLRGTVTFEGGAGGAGGKGGTPGGGGTAGTGGKGGTGGTGLSVSGYVYGDALEFTLIGGAAGAAGERGTKGSVDTGKNGKPGAPGEEGKGSTSYQVVPIEEYVFSPITDEEMMIAR